MLSSVMRIRELSMTKMELSMKKMILLLNRQGEIQIKHNILREKST